MRPRIRSFPFISLFLFYIVIFFVSACAFLSAQENSQDRPAAAQYRVAQAASPIWIDGVMDEPAWAECEIIKLLFEWMPGDNVSPPVETDCLVTFDNRNFYVGFRCYDPDPSQIRAHLMNRDSISTFVQDDHVTLIVDTFNDERRGFQFRVNPLGVQADAISSDLEGYEDFSWDAIWKSEAQITDWGYAVEIAIPVNQLRFPETSEVQTWGFSAERSYPRNVRHRIKSHRLERDIVCQICQFNKITGIQGISPGLNLELAPTLTAVRTDSREDLFEGDMAAGKINADPGLSARWGITPNMILNATANPDFSQVEADVVQLEVNTRFALRYPEKRPFFLEGADFFLTPIEAVFTRTIADPMGGIKFTGKIGKNAFGLFGAYDRLNNLLFPSNQESLSTSLEQNVFSGVFRYRRDVGESSTVGFLYTGRLAEGYYNHVAGFDGFLRLSPTDSFRFQYLHSETQYPHDTARSFGQDINPFSGFAFFADYSHSGRNWYYGVTYSDRLPGFRADTGYIPRVGIRQVQGDFWRNFWGKSGGWFTQMSLGVTGGATWDHDGNLTDQEIYLRSSYRGPLQSRIVFEYSLTKELYLSTLYSLDYGHFYAGLQPAGGLLFQVNGVYGDAIDYSNARQAVQLLLVPSVEAGLGRHINCNLSHTFQRMVFQRDKIFEANLSQARLVYNFSTKIFIRAIVQYLHLSRNPGLYNSPVLERTQTFFTQFLFSYKLNPQTVLFLGYSDNYLEMTNLDMIQTDRTFFIKIGYAWTR